MTSVVKRGTLALFPNSGEWTATSAEHPSMCQLEHVRRENPLTRWCRTDDVEANVAMENKHTASSVLHDCDCFSGRSHPIARHHVKTCVDNYLGFKRAPIAKSAEASCPVEMSSCKNTAAKLYCSPASRPAPPPVCFGHRECHAGVQPFCCKPHFDDPHFRPFVSCTSTPFASPKVADDYSAAAVVLEKKNNTHYNKNFKESHCRAFSQSETSVCLPLNTSRRIHGPGVSTPPPPPLIEGLNTQGHIRVVKPGHPDAVCLMRDSSPTAKTTRQDILWECCTFHGRDVTPATTCASPQSPLLPKALSSHTACPSFSDATVAACNARESEHNPQKHIHAMDGTWQDSSSKTTNVLCIASEQPRPFDVPSAELKKPSGPLTPNATSLSQNALQCQPSAVEDVGPDGFAAAAVHKPVLLSLRNAPITHSWKSLETAVGIMEIPKDIIWVRRRCRCRRFTRLSGSTSSVAFELARDNTACSKEWSKLSHLDRQPMPYVPIYYVQRRNCRLLWSCCRGSRYTLSEHEVQAIAKLSYISQHPYDPCNPLHERLLHKYWLAGLHALASSQHLLGMPLLSIFSNLFALNTKIVCQRLLIVFLNNAPHG